jgi:hypothetical protein
MKKSISMFLVGVAALGFAFGAMAAPYSVTYSDTANGSVLGINSGEPFRVRFVFDNGNSSAANQSWSASSLQCVIFTFNNAQDKYVAINYAGNANLYSAIGNFTTDGSGQLQAGTIDWEDGSPINKPFGTNIIGINQMDSWYINASNDVLYWNNPSGHIGFTNVSNDTQISNWSNPTPANGVCSQYVSTQAKSIPTLDHWGMILLSSLLALGSIMTLRRLRQ